MAVDVAVSGLRIKWASSTMTVSQTLSMNLQLSRRNISYDAIMIRCVLQSVVVGNFVLVLSFWKRIPTIRWDGKNFFISLSQWVVRDAGHIISEDDDTEASIDLWSKIEIATEHNACRLRQLTSINITYYSECDYNLFPSPISSASMPLNPQRRRFINQVTPSHWYCLKK